MKKILPLLCLIFLASGCSNQANLNASQATEQTKISSSKYVKQLDINSKILNVELAVTDKQKQQGLSNRSKLNDDAGMLFDFTKDANNTPGFWMKEMNFNLDLIWIKDNVIISINQNVAAPDIKTPLNQLPVFYPPSEIDYVLEVNGNWSQKNNVRVGDKVKLIY